MTNFPDQIKVLQDLNQYGITDNRIGNIYIGAPFINERTSEIHNKNTSFAKDTKQVKKDSDDETKDTGKKSLISKEKPKKNLSTRLEIILTMHEKIDEYCEAEMDHEAFGYLQTLCSYGKSISMLSTYVNFYETLLMTDRGHKADTIFEKIYSILTSINFKVTFKECLKQGEKYLEEKKYFKSMLFHLVGGHILLDELDADRLLKGTQGFMLGIKMCVMEIDKESSSFCETVKLYIVPKLQNLCRSIFDIDIAKSKKDLVLVEVLCLHHLEIAERFSGHYDAAEKTLQNSLGRMEAVLGADEARKRHLYGAALTNLGALYLQTKRPDDALQVILQAIEVLKTAIDYDDEEERSAKVDLAERALIPVQEIISSGYN